VSVLSPDSVPLNRDQGLFLALTYARLGAPAKAQAVLDSWERRQDPLGRRQAATFVARVRGAIALAEGKSDSAVAYFRRGDSDADGLPTHGCASLERGRLTSLLARLRPSAQITIRTA